MLNIFMLHALRFVNSSYHAKISLSSLSFHFHFFRLARAGAVAEYVNGFVLFCGGRNGDGVHSDCLIYDPTKDMWSDHSRMTRYVFQLC